MTRRRSGKPARRAGSGRAEPTRPTEPTLAARVRDERPDLSWGQARKLVAGGRVRVDGQVVTEAATRIRADATVTLDADGAAPRPDHAGVDLVHVDHEIVVVTKPAGMLTVAYGTAGDAPDPAQVHASLAGRVHAILRKKGGPCPPPRIVQRLDRETSGLVIMARTRRAERALQLQFRNHDVERRYLALCWGEPRRRTHETWIVPDRGDGRRGSAKPDPDANNAPDFDPRDVHPEARRAVTHVAPMRRFARGDVTLVACRLETGRQHQIRIHLAESRHPLLGDRVYLGPRGIDVRAWSKDHAPREQGWGVTRTMLHADELGVVHPGREVAMKWTLPPPADFEGVLGRLRTLEADADAEA